MGLNHEARNIVYDNLRAFPLVTFLCYIPGGSATDDEIERCICGIIVSLNGAHRWLERVKLVVSEIVLEADAYICQLYVPREDEGLAKIYP